MADVTWHCCHLGAFWVHHTTMHHVTSCKSTYIRRMHIFNYNLPLHFWHNDRGLLRATAHGCGTDTEMSQHRKLTLEKKILRLLLQGFEPATLRSRVRRSNHWAIHIPPVAKKFLDLCRKERDSSTMYIVTQSSVQKRKAKVYCHKIKAIDAIMKFSVFDKIKPVFAPWGVFQWRKVTGPRFAREMTDANQ